MLYKALTIIMPAMYLIVLPFKALEVHFLEVQFVS